MKVRVPELTEVNSDFIRCYPKFSNEIQVLSYVVLPSTSELHHSCITELRQTGDDASATHQ